MILKEELFDAANGISTILIDAINKKWDSISNFNSIVVNLQAEGYDDMIDVINSILEDEHNHVGQLQKLVEILNPEAEEIEVGKEEAEETLDSESTVVELPESLLRESADFSQDIYDWLVDHYGTAGWETKFNSYIERIKKSGYNAITLASDTSRAIKQFCKEIHIKPSKITSAMIQESLRNKDNIDRNKRLVKKESANESLQEDIDENAGTYYVSYYEESPAYHPEEGGYYVATCELIDSEEFTDLESARQRIQEKAEEDMMEKITDEFYLDRSKYIGGDRFYIIETEKGSEEKGDEIYQ